MIEANTVLILGAGASVPYGFPTGWMLKREVEELPPITQGRAEKPEGYTQPATLPFEESEISYFKKALSQSGTQSVDAFLEGRSDLTDIGKAAMVHVLLGYEDVGTLFHAENCWYHYLIGKMRESAPSLEGFMKNRLSVVTFNYDRSLEMFLTTSLKNSLGVSNDEAAEAVKQTVDIVHVYGQLGAFFTHDPDEYANEYGPTLSGRAISVAATAIRIIHETDDGDSDIMLVRARKLIMAADRVFVLGFGFHAANLRRLRLSLYPKEKKIIASTIGLTGTKRSEIYRDTDGRITKGDLCNGEADVGIIDVFENHLALTL
jgi:hypothetical protein